MNSVIDDAERLNGCAPETCFHSYSIPFGKLFSEGVFEVDPQFIHNICYLWRVDAHTQNSIHSESRMTKCTYDFRFYYYRLVSIIVIVIGYRIANSSSL